MLEKIAVKPYLKVLVLFTLFCLVYLFSRNAFVHNSKYNFLIWNLFLGFVPFLIAYLADKLIKELNKLTAAILIFVWLLFYPNAPYMITDFIHVKMASTLVLYDALLIFSFSILSLFFGFYSLKLIEKILTGFYKTHYIKLISFSALVLSSFGVYLGRVLRLNSWDFFTNFYGTLQNMFDHLFPVTKNLVTYIMVILFTIIQWLLINLIQDIKDE